MQRQRQAGGFTLIELMIVVAIIAILAAIAYPTFIEQIKRGHRSSAKAILMENAQFLERNFTEATKYHVNSAGGAVTLPVGFSPKPGDGTAMYEIRLDDAPDPDVTYVLSAIPVTDSRMDGDKCGTLTLNELGQKGVTGTASVADCWGR